MTGTMIAHPSLADRRAHGLDARAKTPPSSHAGWTPAPDRPDPIALLEEQNRTREPDLVPVRHGRMVRLAVHLLPWRGEDHGRRPGRHPDGGVDGAAVR